MCSTDAEQARVRACSLTGGKMVWYSILYIQIYRILENAMAFQPAPNMAEAVIRGTISTKPIANVVNFLYPSAYAQANIDALCGAVDSWVASYYKPLISDNIMYQETLVRGLTTNIDLFQLDSTSAGVGTAVGAALPANSSLCMTLRTGFTGRSARGRFYAWPTSSGATVNAQTFTGAYVTVMRTALLALQSAALATGWTLVILSRRNAKALRPVAIPYTVTSISARNDEIDSQKGRLSHNH